MRGCFIASVLVCVALYAVGCGGGSGGGGDSQATTVMINTQSLAPFSTHIRVGDTVTWVNSDTQPHFVVSGVLQMVPVNQHTTHTIMIQQNNSFVPPTLDANFGDTIRWQNNRNTPYALNIVDEFKTTIATLAFAQGQIVLFNSFQFAGVYAFVQADITSISGFIRLFGVAAPDDLFHSQVLPTGGSFQRQFSSAGTFTYFITSQSNPNTSFLSGTIVVQ